MERPAQTAHPIHDLLRCRWSPLAFADRALTAEQLGSLLEAARWAPSCYNEQPWSFIVATRDQPAEFDRLASCLVEANQVWARQAPVLMLSVARLRFDRNGQENRHAWYDVGQAAAHLTFQAAALGLYVHQMAGFSPEKARELFGIPATHEPVSALALGYYGEHDHLPENLRQRERGPRQRKALRNFVFTGRWGQPAAFLTSSAT
jgi:nitroreductase